MVKILKISKFSKKFVQEEVKQSERGCYEADFLKNIRESEFEKRDKSRKSETKSANYQLTQGETF